MTLSRHFKSEATSPLSTKLLKVPFDLFFYINRNCNFLFFCPCFLAGVILMQEQWRNIETNGYTSPKLALVIHSSVMITVPFVDYGMILLLFKLFFVKTFLGKLVVMLWKPLGFDLGVVVAVSQIWFECCPEQLATPLRLQISYLAHHQTLFLLLPQFANNACNPSCYVLIFRGWCVNLGEWDRKSVV